MRIEDGDLYKELRQYLGQVYKYSINVSSFYYQNKMVGISDTPGPPSKDSGVRTERDNHKFCSSCVPVCRTSPIVVLYPAASGWKWGTHHQIHHHSNLGFVSGAGHTFWVTGLWCDSPGACLIGTRSCKRPKTSRESSKFCCHDSDGAPWLLFLPTHVLWSLE